MIINRPQQPSTKVTTSVFQVNGENVQNNKNIQKSEKEKSQQIKGVKKNKKRAATIKVADSGLEQAQN